MKNKKIYIIIILFIIICVGVGSFIFVNKKNNTQNEQIEITPEQEISDEQMRETLITLYFLDSQTGNLKAEGRLIDAKNLISNPYETLINLLIEGPHTEDLSKIFPENTSLISAKLEENCVTIDFSDAILNFSDETQKLNIVNSILNTLVNLNEVDSIKILVNGQKNDAFENEYSALY